jgi:hypothetical protein
LFSVAAGQFAKDHGIEIIGKIGQTVTETYFGIFELSEGGLHAVQLFTAPPDAGEIAVGEFDGDGFLDIVFPVGGSSLCLMFNSGGRFFSDTTCTNASSTLRFEVEGILEGARPEVGDLTLTGTPDVAIAVTRDGRVMTEILLNDHCQACEPRKIEFVGRTRLEGEGRLFDIFDNGHLDLVTEKGAYISTLAPNYRSFVRVTALNGHCLDGCKGGERYPDPPPIATTASSAVSRIVFTDSVGNHHQRVAVQPPGLPYAVVGLGDTVHYIDEVTVASTIGEDVWRWLLPNSKLYTSGRGQNRVYLLWTVEPFLILFGIVSLILGLGFAVLIFSRKEEDEDKKEAEEVLPLF